MMLAMTAVISLEAVGVILITAMLVTPATTAYLLVKRLPTMMLLGALICSASGVFGIFLSWHSGIAPSAAIVLTMTTLFLLAYLFSPRRGIIWVNWIRPRFLRETPEEL
jgi:ABC-type Mn2+/Zn2+ transport system permease subunit